MKGLATEKDPTLPTGRQALRLPKVGPWHFLFLTFLLFFMSGHTALAGVIRKPPNNLGLVAYWPMDEGNGTTLGDASGNGHNGTLAGLVFTTPQPPTWVGGKFGKALKFITGQIQTPNKVTFSPIAIGATHTVSMWLYLTADCTGYGDLFSENDALGLWCLKPVTKNKINYYGTSPGFSNTDISLNQWHHIAVTSNAGSVIFYLDGVADGTSAGATGYNANTMGSDPLNESLPGIIDDLRVYNRALSATEIAYIYKSGSTKIGLTNPSPGTLKNGLTGHWTFDGKDMVSNAADVSGNGRNGYLTNFTSTTTSIGKIGQALVFDNTNKYVKTTEYTWSDFITASDGTISAWVRPKGASPSCASTSWYACDFAVASPSALMGFGILRGNNTTLGADKIWVTNSVTSWSDIQAVGVTYNVNEWIYVTWVHSGGTLSLYKNGDFVGSTSSGDTNTSVLTSNMWIGRGYNGNSENPWNGDIDEVRTYNRALSASEIKQLANISAVKVAKTSTPTGSLQTGLKGWWTFDGKDMVSNVADVSGNGNNGTLTNFTSTTTAIGKIGQALNFDGVDDMVNVGLNASLKPGTGSYSVSLWYKGTSGTGEVFARQGVCIAAGKPCWYIADTSASFGMDVYPFRIANMNFTLPTDNEWHHLVVVLNRTPSPDTLVAYVDGTATGTQTSNSLDNDNLIPTNISTYFSGSVAGGDIMRQGPMDDVRIYNKALSATEVKQLYNLGK